MNDHELKKIIEQENYPSVSKNFTHQILQKLDLKNQHIESVNYWGLIAKLKVSLTQLNLLAGLIIITIAFFVYAQYMNNAEEEHLHRIDTLSLSSLTARHYITHSMCVFKRK